MQAQLKQLLNRVPRRYRSWLALAALVAVAVAQQFGFGGPNGGHRDSGREPGSVVAGPIEGRPNLVDGDSFKISGDEVRLKGIDAPEGRQMCRRNGRDWDCGNASRDALKRLIAGRPVRCDGVERDQHGRALAFCKAGNVELNRAMVAQGYAVAYGSFRQEQAAAKRDKLGIWASEFDMPRTWRRNNNIGR